jgi:uncharacterized protein YbgA (DUF1722 family)/uncharacterized protein YbbK (DUF523 family)
MPDPWMRHDAPIKIGVSTCLLGEEVRFDGGHKRDRFLTDQLAPFIEFVPVCPEVEVGMGIPRPALRLHEDAGEVRLVEVKSGRDHTRAMKTWSRRRVRDLERLGLCGYVLKKGSPSCGMERVKVWRETGQASKQGRGLFADELLQRFAWLPVEEEGRLNDPAIRENFVERIFAAQRIRLFFDRPWKVGDLIRFHTAHKLQLMAHSQKDYTALGRLVANSRGVPRGELRETYESTFMSALRHRATPRRHTNVLQHMAGHFKKLLDPGPRRELAEVIEDYHRGLLPLIVPVTLIRHHVRSLDVAYLAGQVYLEPHPKELMLRNHV